MSVSFSSAELDALRKTIEDFRPSRLVLAREASQLEAKELAERIGATPSAISQLERGTTRPKIETLLRLSLTLGVPPEFFAAPEPPNLSMTQCHFRRRRGTPMREQRYVVARGRIVCELVRHLEEYVAFPSDAISPLQALRQGSADGRADMEALAEHVRDTWELGLGPIPDVVGLLENHGVLVVEVKGHSDRLDAFSVWADGRPLIFLSTDKNAASRRRFDAAHELGHLIAHRHCKVGEPALEAEADRFASAFLLPEGPFRAECPARLSWPALRVLKQRWGASLQALVRRAYDLGIFSEATYRRAYVQLSQFGWRTGGEPDEPLMERPTLVQMAIAQLAAVGLPPAAVASALGYGTSRLFEEAVWPSGTRRE